MQAIPKNKQLHLNPERDYTYIEINDRLLYKYA